MIAYSGMYADGLLAEIKASYHTIEINEEEISTGLNVLSQADAFLLGPAVADPVRMVQKIYAADKHLSVIILPGDKQLQQVKKSLQFSAFVGKNAMVVPVNAVLNVKDIIAGAITRTRQKRSFARMDLHTRQVAPPPEKVRPGQMGSFLEHAPIGAILMTTTGKVVNFNKAAKKLFPTLQLSGSGLYQLLSHDAAATLNAFLHATDRDDTTIEIQVQKKILELSSAKIFTEEGEEHDLLLLNDITEQKQETERIHSIIEALPQMAWTTNAAGATFYFNRGWYHYTGQTQAEALGWGWTAVVHPDDVEKLTELWKLSAANGTPLQYAVRYRNTKGEYRWHLTRATPIRNTAGEVTIWVGTCTDIHDQVLLTEELERKVKERTVTLEAMNAELEQFAHVSSHDLQEPLRKIRTFAELLKDHSYESLDDQSKKYLDKINATAERMSNSLKALLNYTKMQRHERFITVNLDEIVQHILVDLELVIQQKQAIISKDTLPVIKAAPVQMQQLFYNLVNNALKFSKPGIPPVITIRSNTVQGSDLVERFPGLDVLTQYHEIIVADNGIGFDQQHANKIFHIFQRLHQRTVYEGTGIGLSLVKRVVQNHKGEVYAVSGEGEGAAFHILLPAYSAPGATDQPG